MRFNSVGFALSVGMGLVVVLFAFTLLSAGGLAGFAASERTSDNAVRPVDSDSLSGFTCEGTGQPYPTAPAVLSDLPPTQAKQLVAGETLFNNNCAQCHAVNEPVVGPALAGITKRRPISWLIPWIKNSSKVVASGDDYGLNLFTKFNKQQMPSFALSDKEITSIVAYITWQEGASVAVN